MHTHKLLRLASPLRKLASILRLPALLAAMVVGAFSAYAQAPVFTAGSPQNIKVGVTGEFFATASNNPTYTFAWIGNSFVGTANFNPSGEFTLNPSQPGSYQLQVTATNSSGSAQETWSFTAYAAPVFTSSSTIHATAGMGSEFQVTATNTALAYTLLSIDSSFSGNMTIDNNGLLEVDSNNTGSYAVTIQAGNPGGTTNQNVTVVVSGPQTSVPTITSAGSFSAVVGQTTGFQVTASNVPTEFGSYWSGGQPSGTVSFNPYSGYLSITPTASGTFTFMVGAENNVGWSNTVGITVTVTGGSSSQNPPVITSSTTINATVGQAVDITLQATNSPTEWGSYWSGTALPGSFSFNDSTGEMKFTASQAGTYNYMVGAGNAAGWSPTVGFTINVAAASQPPVITSSTSVSATVGQTLNYQVTATNSPTEFGSYWSGSAPSGSVSFNSSTGLLTITPNASGTFTFMVGAGNAAGWSPTVGITITVNPSAAPVITSSTSISGSVGTTLNYQVTATNSPTQYGSYWSGSAPSGSVSFNDSTGLLSINANASGTFTFMVGAGNAAGWSPTTAVTITIH